MFFESQWRSCALKELTFDEEGVGLDWLSGLYRRRPRKSCLHFVNRVFLPEKCKLELVPVDYLQIVADRQIAPSFVHETPPI